VGGAGNDILIGAHWRRQPDRDASDDSSTASGERCCAPGPGNDTCSEAGATISWNGNEAHDTISGGDGKDTLTAGPETIAARRHGADIVNGGEATTSSC
jgi:Ca2+-binding RTX toxin-like protein